MREAARTRDRATLAQGKGPGTLGPALVWLEQSLIEEDIEMKRIAWIAVLLVMALTIGFVGGMNAAGKAYQFTGTVKSNDGGTLTVEKSAKETWTFSTNKDTKGTAKVGDKVTVYYTMIATEIETKPAPASAKKPK